MDYTLLDKLKEILSPQPQNTGVGPTLANQAALTQAQQPQAQPLPAQAPASLPALPNFNQPNNSGGGGLVNALGNMGKSFLGTAAETLPTAIFNAALFGNNPQSRMMTYSSMVDRLDEKRKKEEEARQNKIADWSSAYVALKKAAKDRGLDDETIGSAFLGGSQTGNPEIDSYMGQLLELMKANKVSASDAWAVISKADEYNKFIRGDVMSPEKFKQEIELKKAGQKPTEEPASMKEYRHDVENFGFKGSFADWEKSKRPPQKPETPTMREVWPTDGGESIWIRNDVPPPKGYTGIKPEKPAKNPTPEQALKVIAAQKKIIAGLENTGGISPLLLANADPESLKLLQKGDVSGATQAAQDVIDYYQQFVPIENKKSPEMNTMPNPGEHKGKVIKDTVTGKRYKSDGKTWVEIK